MKKIALLEWEQLPDREPRHALVADVDLVILRFDDQLSVLYGRCAHRGVHTVLIPVRLPAIAPRPGPRSRPGRKRVATVADRKVG